MVKSFSLLSALKGKTSKQLEVNTTSLGKRRSPTTSMASFSSTSTASSPDSPTMATSPYYESRGIFRTLEPIWYFHHSVAPGTPSADSEGWILFDGASARMLEGAYGRARQCTLTQSVIGVCTVMFESPLENKRPTSLFGQTTASLACRHATGEKTRSIPSIQHTSTGSRDKALPPVGQVLHLHRHVRRSLAPVWWFEQDAADGQKGMCRFDARNQVRLEALSDDKSRLTLSDQAFSQPFTVMLDGTVSREQREEMRGFLYLQACPDALQLRLPPGGLDPKQSALYHEIMTDPAIASWEDAVARRTSM